MRKSTNFEFKLPEAEDYYNVEDFNNNFESIDSLLNNCKLLEQGYTYIGKNILLQWGRLQLTAVNGVQSISFPIEFDTVFNVQINGIYTSTTDEEYTMPNRFTRLYDMPTNTGFSVYNTKVNMPVIFWFAVGSAQ